MGPTFAIINRQVGSIVESEFAASVHRFLYECFRTNELVNYLPKSLRLIARCLN